MQILYLGIEGVLLARRPPMYVPRVDREHFARQPLPLLEPLAKFIAAVPSLDVVINSWLIADFGFRRVLQWLPDEIGSKTIGATLQGNRSHRRAIPYHPRSEILKADACRRRPPQLTILDGVWTSIPTEYRHRALVIDRHGLTDIELQIACLSRLLTSAETIDWGKE